EGIVARLTAFVLFSDTPRGLKPHGFSGDVGGTPLRSRLKAVPPPRRRVTSIAVWRGEHKPPLKRSAPRPRCVPAVPRGNDFPRNRHTVCAWQGASVLWRSACAGSQNRHGE